MTLHGNAIITLLFHKVNEKIQHVPFRILRSFWRVFRIFCDCYTMLQFVSIYIFIG